MPPQLDDQGEPVHRLLGGMVEMCTLMKPRKNCRSISSWAMSSLDISQ
jgi:hypothetical protein